MAAPQHKHIIYFALMYICVTESAAILKGKGSHAGVGIDALAC